MKKKHIIGILIIIGFGYYAITSFDTSITRYVSIQEAIESGSMVQVKGKRANSGMFDVENNVFTFTLEDENGKKLDVIFDGAKPGNFDQATEVVCKGQYKEGKFHAKDILVKCPSKYQEEGIQT
jgi:cytochrome c-type biogenesis protein CcmE